MPVTCPRCRNEILVPSNSESARAKMQHALEPSRLSGSKPNVTPSTMRPTGLQPVAKRRAARSWGKAPILALAVVVLAIGLTARLAPSVSDSAPSQGNIGIAESDDVIAQSEDDVIREASMSSDLVGEAPQTLLAMFAQPAADAEAPSEIVEESTPAPSAPSETPVPKSPSAEFTVKRRHNRSELQLRNELAWTPEIRRLSFVSRSSLLGAYASSYRARGETLENADLGPAVLLRTFPDFSYLPIRNGASCRMPPNQATTLDVLSRKLRISLNNLAPQGVNGVRPDPARVKEHLWYERNGSRPEWLRAEAIPALTQLLMHEEEPLRRMLVELLAEIPEKPATVALAQRAVFDLSPSVREAALGALRARSREEVRPVFIQALRYPWAPAADHAAEALVALADTGAIPRLKEMLQLPDPAAPVSIGKSGRQGMVQVVRMHHLSNCMVCHPPACTSQDPVLGVQPSNPGSPAVAFSIPQGNSGRHDYSRPASRGTPILIRGDVTYVRQDFSVLHASPIAGAPPERFDYVLRLRPLSPAQARSLETRIETRATYAQREAVLFALNELEGGDGAAPQWTRFAKPRDDNNASAHNGTLGGVE
jgi:hypothetical protein